MSDEKNYVVLEIDRPNDAGWLWGSTCPVCDRLTTDIIFLPPTGKRLSCTNDHAWHIHFPREGASCKVYESTGKPNLECPYCLKFPR